MGQKPISIMINDFKQDLMNYISNAGLPPAIVEPILKDIYNQIIEIAQQELQQDIERYQQQQAESQE